MLKAFGHVLAALGVAALAAGGLAADDAVLRVCADPDNLPFSAAAGTERGLYVDLAELVAARLGARTEYTWWHTAYGQRAVRNTLLTDRCDVFFGLPNDPRFMGRQIDLTRPFMDVGYAVVVPPSFKLSRLEDLKAVTVAVQFRSEPQIMLASRDGFRVSTFRLVEEAMDALAKGEAGAAFVWGPTAGYYNKTRLQGAWRVVPVAGSGLSFQVAVAVRKGDAGLKARIDRALVDLSPDIGRLADRYGFPRAAPIDLEAAATAPSSRVAAIDRSVTVAPLRPLVRTVADGPVNPYAGDPEAVPAGRKVFNQHCSHCHSPNAQSPEPTRDLRRLKRRYGERRIEVFYVTVRTGRPTQGMPPLGLALNAEEIWKIWSFLESVQAEP